MDHATHVAGIIAANVPTIGQSALRKNYVCYDACLMKAMKETKILPMQFTTLLDNGASIINMSAGKYFSPDADKVVEAIRYAESKRVFFFATRRQ